MTTAAVPPLPNMFTSFWSGSSGRCRSFLAVRGSVRQCGRARRFLARRLDGVSREAGGTEIASRQGRRPRQVADAQTLMREIRVTPPLALHLNRSRDGNDLRTGESGRRREVSDRVEAERLGAVKADETVGKG